MSVSRSRHSWAAYRSAGRKGPGSCKVQKPRHLRTSWKGEVVSAEKTGSSEMAELKYWRGCRTEQEAGARRSLCINYNQEPTLREGRKGLKEKGQERRTALKCSERIFQRSRDHPSLSKTYWPYEAGRIFSRTLLHFCSNFWSVSPQAV